MATTIGFFGVTGAGVAGFAVCATELVLVVGIAAETLSSGAAGEVEEVSDDALPAAFLALVGSVAAALFLEAVALTAGLDVVVEVFTVAVFAPLVFAFVFEDSAFTELFAADFTGVFAASGFALFAVLDVFGGVVVAAFVVLAAVFVATAFAGALAFAGADFVVAALVTTFGSAFLEADDFLAGVAAEALEPVSFLAAAVTLLTADFTPAALVADDLVAAVFLALVVAALGMRSTSWAVQAAPP